jgi:sterol desaturase/sphingolipid hydroxylase (fatty acid hydroxylase superfamily)
VVLAKASDASPGAAAKQAEMKNQTIFVVIAGAFLVLLVVERVCPLRERTRSSVTRLIVNVGLSAFAYLIGAYLITPVSLGLAGWAARRPFGVIHLFPALPGTGRALLGFLLMDLSFYYWHRANHRIPALWRFHNVHHIDPDLDVSTAVRFHFGEILFSTGFRAIQISLIGVSPRVYFLYEFAFQGNTLIHHSNVRLPVRVESLLNKFLVTPRMHGIHHSVVESETNSNYSVVLSWWDRLHHTLRLNVPQAAVVVGVPAYLSSQDNNLWNALMLPFRKQRDYWLYPDGSRPARTPKVSGQDRSCMMD